MRLLLHLNLVIALAACPSVVAGEERSAEVDALVSALPAEWPPARWLGYADGGHPTSQRRAAIALLPHAAALGGHAQIWLERGFFAGPEPSELVVLVHAFGAEDRAAFLSMLDGRPGLYAGLFAHDLANRFPELTDRFAQLDLDDPAVAGARAMRFGAPEAYEALARTLHNPDEALKWTALAWLGEIPSRPGPWTRIALDWLNEDPAGPLSEPAAVVLHRHGPPQGAALDVLVDIALQAEHGAATAAARCLVAHDHPLARRLALRMSPQLTEERRFWLLVELAALPAEAFQGVVEALVATEDRGNWETAIRSLARWISQHPDSMDPPGLMSLAHSAMVRPALADILAPSLTNLISVSDLTRPEDGEDMVRLARLLEARGEFVRFAYTGLSLSASATATLAEWLAASPDRRARADDLAELLLQSRVLPEAVDEVRALVASCRAAGSGLARAACLVVVAREPALDADAAATERDLVKALGSEEPPERNHAYRAVAMRGRADLLPLVRPEREVWGWPLWIEALRTEVALGAPRFDRARQLLAWTVEDFARSPETILASWTEAGLRDLARDCPEFRPVFAALAARVVSLDAHEFFAAMTRE